MSQLLFFLSPPHCSTQDRLQATQNRYHRQPNSLPSQIPRSIPTMSNTPMTDTSMPVASERGEGPGVWTVVAMFAASTFSGLLIFNAQAGLVNLRTDVTGWREAWQLYRQFLPSMIVLTIVFTWVLKTHHGVFG